MHARQIDELTTFQLAAGSILGTVTFLGLIAVTVVPWVLGIVWLYSRFFGG